MSTKPNIALSRFADTGSAVRTAPTSGERDTGLIGGALIDEGVLNELWFRHYEWDVWLNDGDCAFHNLSATGTLAVTGATTLTGALTANGGIIVPTGQAVALNGTTTLTVGTGAVTFGGLCNANAGIAVPTGQAVTLNGTATLTVGSGAVTMGGTLGVTGAISSQAVRTMIVPLSAPVTNTSGVTAQAVTINASSPTHWVGQIPGLIAGQTISEIRLRLTDSATGPTKVQAHLTLGVDGGIGSPTATSNLSSGSGAAQYITMSSLGLVVAAGTVYIVEADLNTGSANCSLYHLEVDMTGPVG